MCSPLAETGILLADDDPHARSALRLLLEQEPDVRVLAETGAAAELLARVTLFRPRLVLLDWDLPELDPEKFMAAIRDCCPEVGVIALSSRPEASGSALSLGIDHFVCKGDAPDRLLDLIRRARATPAGAEGRMDPG